jgi:hypothetical protein
LIISTSAPLKCGAGLTVADRSLERSGNSVLGARRGWQRRAEENDNRDYEGNLENVKPRGQNKPSSDQRGADESPLIKLL